MCMCAGACAHVGVGVKTSSCVVETYKRGGHGCSCGVSDEKWDSGEGVWRESICWSEKKIQ